MKVLFDARMAGHSGIGRYIRGITRAMLDVEPGLDLRLLTSPGQSLAPWAGLAVRTAVYDAPIYGLREQWAGSRLAAEAAPDAVWHVPHYNAPWRLPRASVVTVHDLTHLERPDLFSRRRRFLAASVLERAVRRAGAIITVSTATRESLLRRLPACEPKVTVIHHGVDAHFRPADPAAVQAHRGRHGLSRYVLFVGSTRGHKNLDRLLAAFRALERDDVDLVLVGPTAEALSAMPPRVRAIGQVPDDALPLWYAGAEALVLPSSNEGFGFPALEALACGTPALVADIPALREIVGGAGRYVDPLDAAALARALDAVLADDAAERAAWRARGLAHARAFRWETAARQTLDVYRAVAAPGRPRSAGRA